MPKFSIIIPCYKVEKYIRECLDSLLAQKVDSWEAICVDDGSPDGTGRALDDYLREHCAAVTESERVIKMIGDEDRQPNEPKRIAEGVLRDNGVARKQSRLTRARQKVEECLAGVSRESFSAALDRLVAEKSTAGVYRFRKPEDRLRAFEGARRFFDEFARKTIELSDGRHVYFAPDKRSIERNGGDRARCWAEYAFHAVSNGGALIPERGYHERWYNPYKVTNFELIEPTLLAEKCVPVLKRLPQEDSVKFFATALHGGNFDVVVRLDEYGNVQANMTEVTFEVNQRKPKKLPRLVALAEAVQTVVYHQTTPGSYPSDKNSLANSDFQRKGGGLRRMTVIHQKNAGLSAARNAALEVATGEWLLYLDSDDVLSPWALETYVKMMEKFPQADILRAGMATSADGQWNWGAAEDDSVGMDVHDRVTMYGIDAYFVQMIFRRSVYGDIRFVGMSWCEERPYVAKCIARAKYVTDTPVVAYGFRVREGSITHRKMTFEEWSGYLDVTRGMYDIFHQSGKRIDAHVLRLIVNRWLEGQLALLYSFLPREFHKGAWKRWFASLPAVLRVEGITPWQKFAARTCMAFSIRFVPLLLCYFPHWLKMKGVHR